MADSAELAAQVDHVMRTTRVLVGVIAASVAGMKEPVTMTQLRVLAIVSERGPMSVTAVAQLLEVHASNATRTCDKLVTAGLLNRRESAQDRRRVELTASRRGRRLVETVMSRRRKALMAILDRMDSKERAQTTEAFRAFADTAGETSDDGAWIPR